MPGKRKSERREHSTVKRARLIERWESNSGRKTQLDIGAELGITPSSTNRIIQEYIRKKSAGADDETAIARPDHSKGSEGSRCRGRKPRAFRMIPEKCGVVNDPVGAAGHDTGDLKARGVYQQTLGGVASTRHRSQKRATLGEVVAARMNKGKDGKVNYERSEESLEQQDQVRS
ncbi:MAG: hypothetical protein Q9162_006590 [Coniocarpon cinnabarinum]